MTRIAVVTGSTRGIGFGLARELHSRGCAVVVTGRSGVDEAVATLGGGDRLLGVTCDVTDADSLQRVWEQAVARFGRVDIWVNNAGTTTTPLPFWQLPTEQVEQTVTTNVLGTMVGTAIALQGMRAQPGGGHVFNVEGMGSKGGRREVQPGVITYGTTKAAVGYLDRALRKELSGGNVHLSSIRPGINVTEHLLRDVHVLPPERWRQTRRIMNVLGDLPETTTPWLADQILAATKSTHIAWLTGRKIAWRFTVAPLRRRDIFSGVDPARLPS